MAKVFVIDVGRCSGCYNCQLACKDEHCENDWRPYAAAQPLTGQFWCRVEENVRGSRPRVRIHYIAKMCAHCENAACMAACAPGAIYRREDGLVLIDPDKCTGCRDCVAACPYDVIYFNDGENIAQKCTGCAHLLDNDGGLPRCVEACPTGAMQFGEEEELAELLKDAVALKPELGCMPRVYYRNIPGRFIGATVYDPIEKEVIIGAKVTLSGAGQSITKVTDDFGDFMFRDLPENTVYDLSIEAEGYETKLIPALCTTPDVNLGDIPLSAVK